MSWNSFAMHKMFFVRRSSFNHQISRVYLLYSKLRTVHRYVLAEVCGSGAVVAPPAPAAAEW